jgi:hypothetical protein
MSRIRVLAVVLIGCACLATAAVVWAAETITVEAKFTPDRLGAPTNVSGTARFASTTGTLPAPITEVTIYGPAGLEVDPRGVAIRDPRKLEATLEPKVCPKSSKAGFGGGTGTLELAKEIIKEPFTLNIFRGPNENGRLTALIYVNAITPVSVQLVLKAVEIMGSKPYGPGFRVKVPLIPTLPGATDASVETAFITLGAPNAAYYKTIHGKRTLFHVRGIVVPKKCPHGGFPYKTEIGFADGTSNTVTGTIACPPG